MRDEWDDGDAGYTEPASPETGEGEGAGEPTIVIEDEGLRHGFTQLPNYLFQVRGLSHSAKLTYALILSYAWQKNYCFPGQKILARDLEVSTRSVIEYLKELQARGLIRIQRRGLGKTNVYHVLRYPPAPANPAPMSPPSPPSPALTPPSRQEVKRVSHQGLKPAAPPDVRRASPPEVREDAPPEVQRGAGNKNAPPAKNATENHKPQQTRAAARGQGRGRTGAERTQGARPAGQADLFSALDAPAPPSTDAAAGGVAEGGAPGAAMARSALLAHGLRGERLLAELTADPGEVLAQIERLRQEVARGVVANPAGWLVEAIRGRYRLPDEDDVPATADAGPDGPDGARAPRDDAMTPALASMTPEAGAWARVCAELRGELTPENYGRWFAPAVPQSYSGERLTVGVPDAFHQQWLDRRLRGAIERAAARALGAVAITFVVTGRA